MADINDLLARLKSANGPVSSASSPLQHPQPQAAGYRPPYVSSAAASPSVERSAILSPSLNASGSVRSSSGAQDATASDRTTNLLNLLKFNQPGGSVSQRSASSNPQPASISDLLGGSRQVSSSIPGSSAQHAATNGNSQDLLLKLLNRPQTSSSDMPLPSIENETSEQAPSAQAADSSLKSENDSMQNPPSGPSRGKSPFTYVNPFEQLAASAPSRSKTPEIRKGPTNSTRGVESPAPSPMPDGRTKIEALLGIGSNEKSSAIDTTPITSNGDVQNAQIAVQEAAMDIKAQLKKPDAKADIESGMSPEMRRGFEEKINQMAESTVADNWEAAEAAESKAEADLGVRVFNFPMRPFVAIDINNLPSARAIREDVVMKIATLRKEFDQIDRTLASATTNFIVYAMSKTGGVRVIRQDDGMNKQVFKGAENQIFNLSINASLGGHAPSTSEAILATGVNGAVYWTSASLSDDFADDDLDQKGFIFPPLPQVEENTSGAQLKTRAKLSSKHPEFFAVGRGKSIHIVWPAVAMLPDYVDKATRVVNSQRYLEERCLKIHTGKAGKDFCFSADDTVIVSLDKAGRLKFWDIREHIDPITAGPATKNRRVEVRDPLMLIPTTSSNEKSWATSVLFVDKEAAMTKGQAMRYLLVGLKQNHTLQLWDLVLGKVVQEVNFPHDNETDPICSITYHAKSGIIAVGHPTRNSVFLIHLSLPRHNLRTISQAQLMQRLSMQDVTLPKPESTAIMSGLRELSLSSVGQLLSLDLTDVSPAPGEDNDTFKTLVDKTLFDAYVMHTRGTTAISFKNEDLGWSEDSKVKLPVDAVAEGVVTIRELRQPLTGGDTPAGVREATPAPAQPSPAKTESKAASPTKPVETAKSVAAPRTQTPPTSVPTPVPPPKHENALAEPIANPPSSRFDASPPEAKPSQSVPVSDLPVADVDTKPKSLGTVPSMVSAVPNQLPTSGSTLDASDASLLADTVSKALGSTLSDVLAKVLGDLFEDLYRRLDDDKRVAEAAGAAKQDAVLRLVSSTLTDNVEKSLNRIISGSIEKSVLPALSTAVTSAIEKKVADTVAQQLQSSLSKDLQAALTAPIATAMQDPKVARTLHDQLTGKITSHVESVFTTTLNQTITPAFQKLATASATKSTAEIEKRLAQQVQELNLQRQADGAKIDKLTKLTTELVDSVRAMTGMLADSQKEIMALQAQLAEQLAAQAVAPVEPEVPVDPEVASIRESLTSGRPEEATIKWLQSDRRIELFDDFFYNVNPAYLSQVNPIVTISVAACVTQSMTSHLAERMDWLNAALSFLVDAQDQDTAQHAPRVMETIIQRVSESYMALMESEPTNALLPKFHALVRLAREVKGAAMAALLNA